MERVDDQGVANGLRQHSIGSAFPAVVVGQLVDGGVLYYVTFFGHRTSLMDGKQAHRVANALGGIYREDGFSTALGLLQLSPYYVGLERDRQGRYTEPEAVSV